MTTPEGIEQSAKKPWYKKPWIWAVIGALVIVGSISNMVKGDDVDPAVTIPVEVQPVEEEPEPTDAEADAEAAAKAADEADAASEAASLARSASLEQAIKDALGIQESFTELYAADPSLWGGYISGVRLDGANAYVTLQIGAGESHRDDMGERAAKALSTLLPGSAVKDISWIIVEDASGVVIDQKQPRPLN